MDLVLELLDDPAYRHVLLNHLPITGLAFAGLMLGWAVYEARWPVTVFALSLVFGASLAVWPVMLAGDAAYPFVFDSLDGVGRSWLDHHTVMAERWGRALYVNAALAAAAIGLGLYRESSRRVAAVAALASTIAALVAGTVIAESGGKIRHPEFRLEDPPVHDRPGRIR